MLRLSHTSQGTRDNFYLNDLITKHLPLFIIIMILFIDGERQREEKKHQPAVPPVRTLTG